VLRRLHRVSDAEIGMMGTMNEKTAGLHESVLRGLGELAKCYPLQTRIMDRTLPYLMKAKSSRDITRVSTAASQVLQSLDVADDEIAMQIAGLNSNLLVDWLMCSAFADDPVNGTE
jgi:hypothetical protein